MLLSRDVHLITHKIIVLGSPPTCASCGHFWGARMDLSRLRSRRGILAMALVAAVARVVPVKAQWTNGCEYGMTNGLVTIGGDNCGVAVPGHMIDGTGTSLDDDANGTVGSFTDTRKEDRQDRLIDRRDHRRRRRGRRTDRKQD